MICFLYNDYTVYFEPEEIASLHSGAELCMKLQHWITRQPMTISLKSKAEMETLSKGCEGFLSYDNEMLYTVIHLSKEEPTHHRIYLQKLWFHTSMQDILDGNVDDVTVRWNGSGDKFTLLAGQGTTAKSFKLMYGY